MIRAVSRLALLLAAAAPLAQDGPQVSVALDPDGPVTVGTPVEVTVTVLVPTYMPEPPVWPDLADRRRHHPPARARHPPGHPAHRPATAGPASPAPGRSSRSAPPTTTSAPPPSPSPTPTPTTNAPVDGHARLPDIAFSATVPAGAEGIDPFLAATSLPSPPPLDGLPDAPKPGDAFTLTLTTTAAGPPAMLLPPLADRLADAGRPPRLPAPAGPRRRARRPPPAPRRSPTSSRPGHLRASRPSTLDWWNTATATRETAATARDHHRRRAPARLAPRRQRRARRRVAIVAAIARRRSRAGRPCAAAASRPPPSEARPLPRPAPRDPRGAGTRRSAPASPTGGPPCPTRPPRSPRPPRPPSTLSTAAPTGHRANSTQAPPRAVDFSARSIPCAAPGQGHRTSVLPGLNPPRPA